MLVLAYLSSIACNRLVVTFSSPLEVGNGRFKGFGLVGIELAGVPFVGKPLGADGKLLVSAYLSSMACNRLVANLCAPLEVGNGCFKGFGLVGIELLLGSIFCLRSRDCTWQIIGGTSDVVLDPFNVSINSDNNRFVVVAVPGTNGNDSSWGNHTPLESIMGPCFVGRWVVADKIAIMFHC